MDENDFYYDMYGAGKPAAPSKPLPLPKAKAAARVLGGLKGQGSHTKTVEIEGELVSFPRAEYVKLLEDQIKEARSKIRDLEAKQQRATRNYGRVLEKIRQLESELKNKIDAR